VGLEPRHVARLTPFRFGGTQAGETAKTCSTASAMFDARWQFRITSVNSVEGRPALVCLLHQRKVPGFENRETGTPHPSHENRMTQA